MDPEESPAIAKFPEKRKPGYHELPNLLGDIVARVSLAISLCSVVTWGTARLTQGSILQSTHIDTVPCKVASWIVSQSSLRYLIQNEVNCRDRIVKIIPGSATHRRTPVLVYRWVDGASSVVITHISPIMHDNPPCDFDVWSEYPRK